MEGFRQDRRITRNVDSSKIIFKHNNSTLVTFKNNSQEVIGHNHSCYQRRLQPHGTRVIGR